MRTATGPSDLVGRDELRQAIDSLFAGDGEVSLFYFAGHGHIEATGGYLCSSDVKTGNDGVPLAEIMTMANQSKVQNRGGTIKKCGNERQTVAPSRVSQSPPGASRPQKGATARVEDRHRWGHVKPDVAHAGIVHP
jgi:hypothetical protein